MTESESILQRLLRWRVPDLLVAYPGIRLVPSTVGAKLAGTFAFTAEAQGRERIEDEYQIEISIPDTFPDELPSVDETGGRIPSSFHRLSDGSLCLSAPTRLRLLIGNSPSMLEYVERCVVPYLYGYSFYERHKTLPFGELGHGTTGLLEDLGLFFGFDDERVLRKFVTLTAMRRWKANKCRCPCGSGYRLGQCHHLIVDTIRNELGRRWFRTLRQLLAR